MKHFYKYETVNPQSFVEEVSRNMDIFVSTDDTENQMRLGLLRWVLADTKDYIEADAKEATPENLWLSTQCRWLSYAKLFPETCRLVHLLAAQTQASQIGVVCFLTTLPGAEVPEHTDEGLYTSFYTRFYIPLICDRGNYFVYKNEKFYCQPGEIWTGDFKEKHGAYNGSERERVVLAVDLRLED